MARNLPTASEVPPTEEPALGMDEGEIGNGATLYFTKAPRIEAWHAFTVADHDAIGMVKQDAATSRWVVKIGRETVPDQFTSSTAAKAFISGYYYATAPRAPVPGVVHEETGKGGPDAAGGTTIVG